MKRAGKIILILLAVFILTATISFVPVLWRKTADMSVLQGTYVYVYYQHKKDAAEDVYCTMEEDAPALIKRLGLESPRPVDVFIYDSQRQMQQKKYGFLIPLIGLDWYIGDNLGDDVILTSPASLTSAHDYETIKEAALHELVHAYVYTINPSVRLWLTEGMALYLTNGQPFQKADLDQMSIPSFADIKTQNPLRFSNIGGYTFAHTYIAYLEQTYGWDKVLKLIHSQSFEEVLGKSEEAVYQEWTEYLLDYPEAA